MHECFAIKGLYKDYTRWWPRANNLEISEANVITASLENSLGNIYMVVCAIQWQIAEKQDNNF